MKLYDSIIVGGGPAGTTAAIYLARYNRSVLILDKKQGRSTYPQINENYLGFPQGIHAKKLRALGHKQAKRFGTEIRLADVQSINRTASVFLVRTRSQLYQSKSIILATGVTDILPTIEGIESYVGNSLFWCITCDGHRTINKKVVVIGHNDEAVTTCLQFLTYTNDLAFLLNCDWSACSISEQKKQYLKEHNIPIFEGKLTAIHGENGYVQSLTTDKGETIPATFIFNQQGAKPNILLARQLGLSLDEKEYILTDEEQRTDIPFVYAAGDVTRLFSHQIITAAHEGATAGQTANYDLYEPFQKE